MRLTDIKGQCEAIAVLRHALTVKKVPHAYLFCGMTGVGKQQTALALAMALNCLEMQSTVVCLKCESCRKITQQVHPDIALLTLPEGKKRIPIESIRAMERKLWRPPYEGRANVAIIAPADMMSEQAANALLKTLEEPRPESYLFLITDRPSAILPTVRSRCQILRFSPLSADIIRDKLITDGADPTAAEVAAALSGGSSHQAAFYLCDELNSRIELVGGLLSALYRRTPGRGMTAAAQLNASRDECVAVLDLLLIILEELLVYKTDDQRRHLCILLNRLGDLGEQLTQRLSVGQLGELIMAANSTLLSVRLQNANSQLAVEGLLLRMRRITDG